MKVMTRNLSTAWKSCDLTRERRDLISRLKARSAIAISPGAVHDKEAEHESQHRGDLRRNAGSLIVVLPVARHDQHQNAKEAGRDQLVQLEVYRREGTGRARQCEQYEVPASHAGRAAP